MLASILALLMTSCLAEVRETSKPNILFILTDDQDPESLGRMANVQNLLVEKGTSFSNAFATTAECCPSRVSFMRGQYVHNHGVLGNESTDGLRGGYEGFVELGLQRSTLATWLDEAGYTTGYMGKYLNGYEDTTYVPPGWDTWYAFSGDVKQDKYIVNENGKLKRYTLRKHTYKHETYYLRDRANAFIRDHAQGGAPWFAWVSTHAPHVPNTVAPEFRRSYDRAKMPMPPSYNEADVSDKPEWIRTKPRVDSDCSTGEFALACHQEVVEEWRARQEALMSVDVMVKDLIGALVETNQMERTYVVFASDNGYLLFRHRVYQKGAPHEESQGVPFVVSGPGVQQRVASDELVANIDLAPTIADWAGVQVPEYVDGRSLDPVLEDTATSWRQYLLFEMFRIQPYGGVRTVGGKTYVEYESGEKEYYDLAADPWQLESAYEEADPALIADLEARLEVLKECAREECREAENGR